MTKKKDDTELRRHNAELQKRVAELEVNIVERKQIADELRMLSTVVKQSTEGMCVTDLESNLLFVNDACIRMHGFNTAEEIIGQSRKIFHNQKQMETDVIPFSHRVKETGFHKGEVGHIRKDGTPFPTMTSSILLKDEHGIPYAIANTVNDITVLKHASNELKRQEQFLTSVLDSVQDGVSVLDSNMTILHANATMKEWYKEQTPLQGKKCYEVYQGRKEPCDPCPSLRCFQSGQTAFDIVPGPPGSPVQWIELFSYPIIDPNTSAVTGVAEFVRDITERKRTMAELEEKEQYYRTLLNTLHEDILVVDRDYRITDINTTFIKSTGCSREEAVGRRCFEVTHGYDVPCHEHGHECRLQNVFESGEPAIHKQVFRANTDDSPTQMEVLLSPVKDAAGQVTQVIEAMRDITHEVQLEAQMRQIQKLESVGRLAGGVAHDFNNMLNVILGHTELALEDTDPAHPLVTRLQEIHTAAHRSADLTRQLLTFARKQTVTPVVLDINETVEELIKMLVRLIGEDIDFAWRPGTGVWPVRADPSQINQILVNLCVNARDAIENVGKVTIETGTIVFDEAYCADHAEFVPGDFVLLAVSDNGCGMDKDMLDHIFEPFFTTKDVDKGTGMGLSTVYGIVKQNKGFVSVYSEPGLGTTFKIYLPRETTTIISIQENDSPEQLERGDETILLVEDEPSILEITRIMLERQGYTVLAVSTPGEAIRLAGEQSGEIDLLLTDVVMPKMNGQTLADNLSSIRPNLKRLFMSGYTANVISHHGVMDEGIHFLQKPFTMQDLAAKVRETLDSSDA